MKNRLEPGDMTIQQVDMQLYQTNFPDIFTYNSMNPTLVSPNSHYEISLCQNRESLLDIETYKKFLENAIQRFRRSKSYKHYKSHLYNIGINRCQFHTNIHTNEEEEMATIEMHHHILTIFDIALIITEHMCNVAGGLSTFDLVKLMKLEHHNHNVSTVMLCSTCHQLQHNDPNFHVPIGMGFGNWWNFLCRYRTGITRDIANKLIYTVKKEIDSLEIKEKNTLQLLSIRDTIINWSDYNEQFIFQNEGHGYN